MWFPVVENFVVRWFYATDVLKGFVAIAVSRAKAIQSGIGIAVITSDNDQNVIVACSHSPHGGQCIVEG